MGGDVEALIAHHGFAAVRVSHHHLGLLRTGAQGAAIGGERAFPHPALQHAGAVGQDFDRGRIERHAAEHRDRIRGRQRVQRPRVLGHAHPSQVDRRRRRTSEHIAGLVSHQAVGIIFLPARHAANVAGAGRVCVDLPAGADHAPTPRLADLVAQRERLLLLGGHAGHAVVHQHPGSGRRDGSALGAITGHALGLKPIGRQIQGNRGGGLVHNKAHSQRLGAHRLRLTRGKLESDLAPRGRLGEPLAVLLPERERIRLGLAADDRHQERGRHAVGHRCAGRRCSQQHQGQDPAKHGSPPHGDGDGLAVDGDRKHFGTLARLGLVSHRGPR